MQGEPSVRFPELRHLFFLPSVVRVTHRRELRLQERRVQKLHLLPQLSLIGDFHSHTGWGDLKGVGIPSTQDIIDMSPEHLNIIMVVNDKRRSGAWQYNGDGTLSGTVDDYHFRIGGYYLDNYSRVKRANIFCPYAIGFNAKESQQKVLLRSASAHQRWLRSKR